MNKDRIEGNWKQVKGKVQERWGELTDDEVDEIEGRTEQLIGKLQARYGRSREEARDEVNEWRREHNI